jgi:hypothetical protein
MAGTQAAPLAVCLLKVRLIAELRDIHARIVSIHSQEGAAYLHGNPRAMRLLAAELQDARRARAGLIRQLKRHLAEHGC